MTLKCFPMQGHDKIPYQLFFWLYVCISIAISFCQFPIVMCIMCRAVKCLVFHHKNAYTSIREAVFMCISPSRVN